MVTGKTEPQIEEFTMIANALLMTIAFLLAYGFWLLDQLKFMAPYKNVQSYMARIAARPAVAHVLKAEGLV